MNIAIIKKGLVINGAVFDDLETAQSFRVNGVWADIGADSIAELPEGYGIGDSYINGEWIKAEPLEPEIIPESKPVPPTLEEQIANMQLALIELYEEVLGNG